jgi:hypothetical protein
LQSFAVVGGGGDGLPANLTTCILASHQFRKMPTHAYLLLHHGLHNLLANQVRNWLETD